MAYKEKQRRNDFRRKNMSTKLVRSKTIKKTSWKTKPHS
jgi:hypothetical protein